MSEDPELPGGTGGIGDTRRIIIFSGPPCSGKSELASGFADWLITGKIRDSSLPTLAALLDNAISTCGSDPLQLVDAVRSREVLPLISMDELRLEILPGADHDKQDRNFSYRAMHAAARVLVDRGLDCIVLDATYGAAEHRKGITQVAKGAQAELLLIESTVSPDDAAQRFRARQLDPRPHAAVDLFDAKVRDTARTFPTYGGTVIINSSASSEQTVRARIKKSLQTVVEHYEDDGRRATLVLTPEAFEDWAKAAESPPISLQPRSTDTPRPVLLSPHSRRQARMHLALNILLVVLVAACVVYGWIRGFESLAAGSHHSSGVSATDVALIVLTGGIAIAALGGLVEFITRQSVKVSWTVVRAGSLMRFGPDKDVALTNREICEVYRERTSRGVAPRFGLGQQDESSKYTPIDGTPICFITPPKPGVWFDVQLTPGGGEPWNLSHLAEVAGGRTPERSKTGSLQPFDWVGYRRWREHTKQREYQGLFSPDTLGLRVTKIVSSPPEKVGDVLTVEGAPVRYTDYLVAEQSVSLEIPGQLPYLREFFEGPAWTTRSIDLGPAGLGSSRYSMFGGVSTLVTTSDGFLLLQRRSGHVQAARGGVACSSGGAIEWRDLRSGTISRLSDRFRRSGHLPASNSLLRSVLRELREELGLVDGDVVLTDGGVFMALAYNLRYGRDLNFYAHLHSSLNREEIADRFYRSRWSFSGVRPEIFSSSKRDRWEIGHLVFIDITEIFDDGRMSSGVEELLQDARHVRGALYAFAVSGRKPLIESLVKG